MKTNGHSLTIGAIPAYRQPPWIMLHMVDPLTIFAVGKLGLDDHNGTRVLEVKGRTSGIWRATPVRLLEVDGRRYLVAMYGNAQWVRNLKARGGGRMRLGRQATDFRPAELSDEEKLPVLRAYLKRYWSLVASMTTVTSPDAPDEELAKAAPLHPVFRLDAVE
jgi:deazaflavin-dependent oxidoreductase (nitroreductase family)